MLEAIVARKRAENVRRNRHWRSRRWPEPVPVPAFEVASLRRLAASPHVIAELKQKSPSAGRIRTCGPGDLVDLARAYVAAGASAISVLTDGPGFGGSALDARRVGRAVSVPILFKEFVLDDQQVKLAHLVGARLVLLIVRILDDATLARLIVCVRDLGMESVVEAADAEDLSRALASDARIVGVNARDLRTFAVSGKRAHDLVEGIPSDRIAVYMSGIRDAADFARVAGGRADAVLIGEGLMRASDPAARLRAILGEDA